MSKHTPGPWVAKRSELYKGGFGRFWVELGGVDGEGNQRLLQTTGSGGARSFSPIVVEIQNHDDNDANAHLIAAAPDMLEALRGLANALEMEPGPRGVMDLVPGAIEKARAAIEKAEGRS